VETQSFQLNSNVLIDVRYFDHMFSEGAYPEKEDQMGKGQGNGGGWPSTTGKKSGGGRSNAPAGGGKGK